MAKPDEVAEEKKAREKLEQFKKEEVVRREVKDLQKSFFRKNLLLVKQLQTLLKIVSIYAPMRMRTSGFSDAHLTEYASAAKEVYQHAYQSLIIQTEKLRAKYRENPYEAKLKHWGILLNGGTEETIEYEEIPKDYLKRKLEYLQLSGMGELEGNKIKITHRLMRDGLMQKLHNYITAQAQMFNVPDARRQLLEFLMLHHDEFTSLCLEAFDETAIYTGKVEESAEEEFEEEMLA